MLSLFANSLAGCTPKEYTSANDKFNETGGSEKHSQTNSARVEFRILDTPGLLTLVESLRTKDKASIVEAMKTNPSVNAVLIIANGTLPRHGLGLRAEFPFFDVSPPAS